MRGYLRIYTLRERGERTKRRATMRPGIKRICIGALRRGAANVGPAQCISHGHIDEGSASSVEYNVRMYLPWSILLMLQLGGLAQKST